MIETAEQFNTFAEQQVEKNVEMIESLRTQHGDLLADKVEMIISIAKHEAEMITTMATLYAHADDDVAGDTGLLITLMLLVVRSKTMSGAVATQFLTEKELEIAKPFITNAVENINRIVQAVMEAMRPK